MSEERIAALERELAELKSARDNAIPKTTLDAIRGLDDGELSKMIEEVSAFGWRKAEETLRMMLKEKER